MRMAGITRRSTLLALAGGLSLLAPARAQQAPRGSRPIVVNNVRIFDGIDGRLKPGNLLIADRRRAR